MPESKVNEILSEENLYLRLQNLHIIKFKMLLITRYTINVYASRMKKNTLNLIIKYHQL